MTKNQVQVRISAFYVKNFDPKWPTEIYIFIVNRRENRKMARNENKMPRHIDFDPLTTNINIFSVFGACLSVKKR